MAIFFQSTAGVLIILGMIIVGYFLARIGWFDDNTSSLFAKLVTQVALPAYMFSTISADFNKRELLKLLPSIRYPAISMFLLFLLSIIVAWAIRIPKARHGLFTSMFFNSNTVFVGLPVNMALFGNRSLPYVLVYYMVNTFCFWTIGVYLIRRDGDAKGKFNFGTVVKKLFSPPLLGFLLGCLFVVMDWHLPHFLSQDLIYIGGLTVPLSMFFIGIAVYQVGLSKLRLDKDTLGIFSGRFIFAPLIMSLLMAHADLPHMMKMVFIIQSAMPVMTNAPVVAKLYGGDSDYAALMVTKTTLMSLIVIPILMTIMQ